MLAARFYDGETGFRARAPAALRGNRARKDSRRRSKHAVSDGRTRGVSLAGTACRRLYTERPSSPAMVARRHASPDEANVPAEEAQARPHARVSCAHADARRPAHDQAPAQEGALAADRLSGAGSVERSAGSDAARRPRLSRSADFDRVYRQGRSVASRHLVLYAFPRERDEPTRRRATTRRASGSGVSVGRAVGGAVERNRVKRLLREAFWSLPDELPDEPRLRGRGSAGRGRRSRTPSGLDGVRARARASCSSGSSCDAAAAEAAELHETALLAAVVAGADPALPAVDLARCCRGAASTSRPARPTPSRRCGRYGAAARHRAGRLAPAALQPVQPRRATTRSSAPAGCSDDAMIRLREHPPAADRRRRLAAHVAARRRRPRLGLVDRRR